MDEMVPVSNLQPSPRQYEESSEPVPSTSSARAVDLTSPIPSTSVLPPIIAGPSTSSMPQMVPVQMTPVHPVPTMNPMSSIPSTSRRIQHHSDDFRFEAARRLSFRYWPATFIDAASLAAAGFYYTGSMDNVRCFECQVIVNHWSKGCTPMKIHKKCSPECRFVRNKHCGNVPIGEDPDKVLRTKRRNRNISCPYGLQYQESFDFNDHRFLRYLRNPTAYELSRLGLKRVKTPENLDYASYRSRLNSFATWPADMAQKSEELADAGFYYTGVNDFTTCYHCGIGLGNWKPEEDPWREHATSSPWCPYLLTVRGEEYINNVTGQEYYETSAEAPTQETVGSDERPNSENEIDEVTLVEKVAALEEENKGLKNARSCKICTEREATTLFLPCGHLATCHFCAPAFGQCTICSKQIKATVRAFLT